MAAYSFDFQPILIELDSHPLWSRPERPNEAGRGRRPERWGNEFDRYPLANVAPLPWAAGETIRGVIDPYEPIICTGGDASWLNYRR